MTEGIIIILGAPNDHQGKLSSIALERCNHALTIYHAQPGYRFLLTGGYGEHFNITNRPHAYYLQQYLIAQGVPEQDILGFAESSNSLEDAVFSKPIVERHNADEIIVVSSDFHLKRVAFIFGRVFPKHQFSFSGSRTHLPQAEMEDLQQHEQRALERLKER